MRLPFTKMSGAGNDFIVLDWRSGVPTDSLSGLTRRLCDRRRGIGADGLLHLERGTRADVRVRYLNADGSDAGMCGNGARCAALEAHRLGLGKRELTLDFGSSVVRAMVENGGARIALGAPREMPVEFQLEAEGKRVELHRVDTGVPHAVVVVDDIEAVPVATLGAAIRRHPALAPAGANVDFVERRMAGAVPMRTYERGVEAETLACGTGAAATAVVATAVWGRTSPIDIATRGGDLLRIHIIGAAAHPGDVILEGSAGVVFTGEIDVS